MILMGFDPPEVQAFSKRARRRLKTLQDIMIEEDNIQDEDEGEDEPLDETFAQEEACEPEEDLQDQAALAEFFNMRFQPTMDTIDTDGNPSKLDEDACTPLFEGSFVSKLTTILLLSNLQQKYNVSNSFMDSLYALLAKEFCLRSLLIQHLGDAMHQEGNVVKNLIQHIWGKADSIKHRRACIEFGMHAHAWPYTASNGVEVIPTAEWVLSSHEKRLFRERIQKIKCPTGYASNFRIAFTYEDKGAYLHLSLRAKLIG
ncbi:hypothetical protein R1flu_014880 [Riccia fluitans]|uniref:Transposase n=1 Tax=Riccia fluitans TaxID=41844 RepID=A0ABD1YIG8_9MARC